MMTDSHLKIHVTLVDRLYGEFHRKRLFSPTISP